ncbi:hypothetical protein BT96DRAFT_979042 [Gymnopus androsaceus JB14]|uniref:non-specific serine/threonine protein kinase n=1 Tax=Gymnopus androsaceus JB14 TaxID=1447944 RepID=A0A6A4H616_9AGAR|nr:hypothetical protein BT96DRAFT_979042 [Gymnopus androsaceus JB14]
MSSSNANSRSLHDYQLGDSLGKGAFGQVYRALNWATGETVAIKQISLSNLPSPPSLHLQSIMSEISLLKNLRHPNIVKYKGFVKTRLHLYIILEFCENGSLAQIGKRFGKFPEGLMGPSSWRISVSPPQFTTGDSSGDGEVVGSPYWMAPEVISQSGATTASDIWSLGCLIIELLSGSPPYAHLDPMPAMWRIVQDEIQDEIPEGCSRQVKDFLACCFQKDPNLRVGARKLLRHAWMVGVRTRATVTASASAETTGDWTTHADQPSLPPVSTSPTQTVSLSKSQMRRSESRSQEPPSQSQIQVSSTQNPKQPPSQTQPQINQNSGTQRSARPRPTKPSQPHASASRPPSQSYDYNQAVARVQEWNQALKGSEESTPLAVPIPHTSIPGVTGAGGSASSNGSGSGSASGSAGAQQTLRPFQFGLGGLMGAPSSSASSSSTSGSGASGEGSVLGSSDKSRTIKALQMKGTGKAFSAPPPVPPLPGTSVSSTKSTGSGSGRGSTKDTKGAGKAKGKGKGKSKDDTTKPTKENGKGKSGKSKGKGPVLIPLSSFASFSPLLGGVGVGGNPLALAALNEDREDTDEEERWDDDFEFGDGEDELIRPPNGTGSTLAGTGEKSSTSSTGTESGASASALGMETKSSTSSSSEGSSGEEEEETTLTSSAGVRPLSRPTGRDDRTIRASPSPSPSLGSISLPPLPPSSSNSRSRSSSSSSSKSASASTTHRSGDGGHAYGQGHGLEGYYPLSEAEEENYDDEYDFSAPSPSTPVGEIDGSEMERRVREFKARTAAQRTASASSTSSSISGTTSSRPRPLLFHPDDIKDALFPQTQAEQTDSTSTSVLRESSSKARTTSVSRPSLHGRTYSASPSLSRTSSSSSSLSRSSNGPAASASKPQRPHLTILSRSQSTPNGKAPRTSPGPMTAPLPNVSNEEDGDVWDGDYDDDYDFSAGVGMTGNGSGRSGSVSAGTGAGRTRSSLLGGSGSTRSTSSASQGSTGSARNTNNNTGTGSGATPTTTVFRIPSLPPSLAERFNKYTETSREDSAEDYEYEYDVDDSSSPGSTLASAANTPGTGSSAGGSGSGRPGTLLKLNSRLTNRSSGGGDGGVDFDWDDGMSDEEDVFAEFDEPFAEDSLETHLQRDKHARLSARVGVLVDELSLSLNSVNGNSINSSTPNAESNSALDGGGRTNEREETREEKLKSVVAELLTILITSPEMQTQLVSSHGMLAILEVLEWYQDQNQHTPALTSAFSPQQYSTSSPNPSPRMRGDIPLPLSGSTSTAPPIARKTSGLGVVSSLGLGSITSLGSLALGGSKSGSPSPLSSSASLNSSMGGYGGSIGVTTAATEPFRNSSTSGMGGGLTAGGREVVLQLLRVVNLLVTGNIGFLEGFCLIGGIPVIMGFTSKRYPSECRLEASNFIRLLCHASVLTLQMFISCRGLKTLVDLLDEDPSSPTQAPLVVHALNGIASVFELQSPTTKNDFCRMFVREGLLDPLSGALLNVMASGNRSTMGVRKEGADADSEEREGEGNTSGDSLDSADAEGGMKMKIIKILLVFSQVSQSDLHVRNAVGRRKVVRRLLRACELLEPECLVLMLKAVKHLSMNVALLDVLQNANAIEILVRILEEQATSPYSTEVSNHIFQTCFNLCRLSKSRQEEAAQAGIIPCLQRVAETQSPLKQFALPILCDMASAGKSCRMLLWQHNGLNMYLKLLEDPYFQASALESILSWLQDEPSRVQDALIKPEAIRAIIDCFVTAKANSFENLLELFLKLTRVSTRVTTAFSCSAPFFRRVADRLAHNTKPVVRLNLLRILKSVCEAHPNRGILVERYGSGDGLLGVVEGLSRGGGDGAVLVRELAKEIIPVLRPGLKPLPGGGRSGGRANVTPRRARRTASEASVAAVGSTGSAATFGTGSALSTSSSRRGVLSPSAARIGSTRPKVRQKLGDIPWQRPGGSG